MPAALSRMHGKGALYRDLTQKKTREGDTSDVDDADDDEAMRKTNWGKMCRASWPDVVHAAKELATLLACLVSEATSKRRQPFRPGATLGPPEEIAAWTLKSLHLAEVAVRALKICPGYGEYAASKVLRNLISWWLERRDIAFPCGELWYDWDSMTI